MQRLFVDMDERCSRANAALRRISARATCTPHLASLDPVTLHLLAEVLRLMPSNSAARFDYPRVVHHHLDQGFSTQR